MNRKLFFFLTLFSFAFLTEAQTVQQFERYSVPVTVNGKNLKYPFAGGLNAPQFSVADLDHDYTPDLVLFDRAGNSLLTFINQGTPGVPDYVFRPEYATNFPVGLTDWMVMRDYDKDGIMDIFCAAFAPSSQEIQLFKGYYDGHGLKFAAHNFSYPPTCSSCNPLYIFYPDDNGGFYNNFPVNRGDMPDFDDIDGDGDIDIVAFPAGTSTSLTMLRNMSVEHGKPLSQPEFELYDNCWGDFFENGMERCNARLSCNTDTCAIYCFQGPKPAEDRDGRHPGASVSTLDYDNDGDKDLLLGNLSYPCIDLMTNGGTVHNAWMTAQDTAFPSYNMPVDIYTFPGTYYLDYDNDGKKDLIAALNNPTSGEDRKAIWLYQNTATTPGLHHFEFQKKDLFVGDMIDVGTAAHPTFADVNADGLKDLVIGNYGFYTRDASNTIFTNARLFLYLNKGTPTAPAFELADEDFAGMSQFAPLDYDFAPTFGDIDGDNDLDLIIGNNIGGVYCFRNTAGPGNPMVLKYDTDPMWLAMDVIGSISTPLLYDLDNDGLVDLLMGERTGNINFFKNNGTPNQPVFSPSPTLQKIGQIDTRVPPEVVGMSAPVILQTNDGPILITGTQRGHLEAYYVQGATESAYSELSLTFGNLDEGNRSSPALADLDGDEILELAVGNQRGGISLYKTNLVDYTPPLATGTPGQAGFQISPNPARGWARVEWPVYTEAHLEVFDALGRLVSDSVSGNGSFNIDVSNWLPGAYIIQARAGALQAGGKLMVVH